MRRRILSGFVILLSLGASPVATRAQLAAPDSKGLGIVMSELHFIVRDVDAQRRFWTAFGGVPVENGALRLIQIPGVFVIVTKGEPGGGTVGSVTNHVGFQVKSISDASAKWKAAGLTVEQGSRPTQVYLTAPEDVRIEILEDTSMTEPLAMHHVHLFTPQPVETQAWYVKTFGASATKMGPNDAAVFPGGSVLVVKGDGVPNHGRVLDHLGLEVKNLEAFCAKLQADGIKLDRPYTHLPNSKVATAFLTDPWGTYIELTENLAPGS